MYIILKYVYVKPSVQNVCFISSISSKKKNVMVKIAQFCKIINNMLTEVDL